MTPASHAISDIKFIPVRPNRGLIGFVSFVFEGIIYFGAVAVHERPEGGIRLVFPRVRGINAYYPIDANVGAHIEAAIQSHIKDVRKLDARRAKKV